MARYIASFSWMHIVVIVLGSQTLWFDTILCVWKIVWNVTTFHAWIIQEDFASIFCLYLLKYSSNFPVICSLWIFVILCIFVNIQCLLSSLLQWETTTNNIIAFQSDHISKCMLLPCIFHRGYLHTKTKVLFGNDKDVFEHLSLLAI